MKEKTFIIIMTLSLMLLITSCATSVDPEYQNTIELYGYIGNTAPNEDPVIFVTDSTTYFIYEYQYDYQKARIKRTVVTYSDNDRLIFINERFD